MLAYSSTPLEVESERTYRRSVSNGPSTQLERAAMTFNSGGSAAAAEPAAEAMRAEALRGELAALIVETGRQAPRDDHDGRALYVSPLRAPLLDAFLRLVRLLDAPQDVSVLAPLIARELHYRLLQSEQFGRLAQMAIGDGRLRRVSGAIAWIKKHFAEPLEIEALAKVVNMSPSALHHHFKAVAAMSPIQYQKRLRLQEARRLLMSGATSAEAIAYEVGYASASQFSREYVRLFGQPPRRDAERMRDAAQGGGLPTRAAGSPSLGASSSA